MTTIVEGKTIRSSVPFPTETNPQLLNLTLHEYLLERAKFHAQHDNAPCQIDAITGEEIRFSDVESLSGNVAAWFFSKGMQKGDVVMYMYKNFSKSIAFFPGVWHAGGVLRSSYPQDLDDAIVERLLESKVKWIYCEAEEVEKCRVAAEKCPWNVTIIVNGSVEGCVDVKEILGFEGKVPDVSVTPEDTAIIMLTSGSTGKPKGSRFTHAAFRNLILGTGMQGWSRRTMLITMGVHLTGTAIPLLCLSLGLTCIILTKIDLDFVFQSVEKYKPKMIFGFASSLQSLATDERRHTYDVSSVEYCCAGGSLMSDSFKANVFQLSSVKGFITAYGTTETSWFLGHSRFIDKDHLEITKITGNELGVPSPGCEIQIRDMETGEILGPNIKGEICVKSQDIFSEYLDNPEATRNAFTVDGFYRTGDIGSYDESGMISHFGRGKEIFKYWNFHINPGHIDEIVTSHPAVLEACTVGVAHSDGFNSVPRVFVTLVPGEKATEEEIIEFANAKMPDYMHIRGGLFIRQSLPRGITGKISRILAAKLEPISDRL